MPVSGAFAVPTLRAPNMAASGLGAMARSLFERTPDHHVGDADVLSGQVDLGRMSRAALKLNLDKRGLPSEGTKSEMRDRLLDWITTRSQFERGNKSTEQEARLLDVAKEERGSVYAVGVNHRGQLGMGDTNSRGLFTCVPTLKGRGVETVSAGPDFAVAVTEDRYVYAWGGGGQIPLGTAVPDTPVGAPTRAAQGSASGLRLRGFDGARDAVSMADDDGRPYPAVKDAFWSRLSAKEHLTPRVVDALRGEGVISVFTGMNHIVAISDGGDVFSWGTGRHGQLGTGMFDDEAEPVLVKSLQSETVATASLGHSHTLAVNRDGVPFAWGRADQGCLGLGTRQREGVSGRFASLFPSPTAIPALAGRLVVRQVACGPTHSVALLAHETQVWSWGDGTGGKLGHGDTRPRIDPCPVNALRGEVVLQVAAGCWHSACIVEQPPFINSGVLFTWGTGLAGQLGLGAATTTSRVPAPVSGFLDKGHSIKFIACGSHHNAALTHDSQLYTWGSNKFGCLGAEVADEFVAYPQKVWAFDVIFDGVGRGAPRSVAAGREFTIVACFPYTGPPEAEAGEAGKRVAEARAEMLAQTRAGSKSTSAPVTRVQQGSTSSNSGRAFSIVGSAAPAGGETAAAAGATVGGFQGRSARVVSSTSGSVPLEGAAAPRTMSLQPSTIRAGRAAAASAGVGARASRSTSPALSDAVGDTTHSPVVEVTDDAHLELAALPPPHHRKLVPQSDADALDTLSTAGEAGQVVVSYSERHVT